MHIYRFVDGEPPPIDKTAIRHALGPITLGGMPPTGLPESCAEVLDPRSQGRRSRGRPR
jgi:hypothetical protein